MAPFDIYYWSAIVNIALSRTISEKKRDSGRKSRFFSYPMHSTPQLGGGPVGILPYRLARKKLERCGYPIVEKV